MFIFNLIYLEEIVVSVKCLQQSDLYKSVFLCENVENVVIVHEYIYPAVKLYHILFIIVFTWWILMV